MPRLLKNLRRVQVDGVGGRHLLTDHEPDGYQHPLAVARDCPHLAQQVFEGSAAGEQALVLELPGDGGELALDVGVRGW